MLLAGIHIIDPYIVAKISGQLPACIVTLVLRVLHGVLYVNVISRLLSLFLPF
jgi:hypothetical protein